MKRIAYDTKTILLPACCALVVGCSFGRPGTAQYQAGGQLEWTASGSNGVVVTGCSEAAAADLQVRCVDAGPLPASDFENAAKHRSGCVRT